MGLFQLCTCLLVPGQMQKVLLLRRLCVRSCQGVQEEGGSQGCGRRDARQGGGCSRAGGAAGRTRRPASPAGCLAGPRAGRPGSRRQGGRCAGTAGARLRLDCITCSSMHVLHAASSSFWGVIRSQQAYRSHVPARKWLASSTAPPADLVCALWRASSVRASARLDLRRTCTQDGLQRELELAQQALEEQQSRSEELLRGSSESARRADAAERQQLQAQVRLEPAQLVCPGCLLAA